MQLSKQEFSKLPKSEQNKLMNIRKNNKKQSNGGNRNRAAKPSLNNSSMRSDTKVSPMSKAPVSQGRNIKTARPKMVTLRNGDCDVTHREYIGEVTASSGSPSIFNVDTYPINPGMNVVFPWLSKIAQNFESYNFRKLKFCYETEAPTSLGGTVVLAVDYDALDAAPASKQQALAYRSSVRSPAWTDSCHSSVGEDLHKLKSKYVRTGSAPATSDLKTYDVGNLFVITQGITTASAVCGELYVEYSVRLMTPVYDNNIFLAGGAIGSAGTVSAANPLGDTPQLDAQASNISVDDASQVTISYPGTYLAVVSTTTATTLTGFAFTAVSGCTTGNLGSVFNAAATAGIQIFLLTVTANDAVVALTQTSAAAGTTSLRIALAPASSLN